MNILVLGGTRFFGVHLVENLLQTGHDVTIATRGQAKDPFDSRVFRIIVERTSPESMKAAFAGLRYEAVYDNLAFASNDIKYAMDAIDCDLYLPTSTMSVYNLHMNISEEEFLGGRKELVWCDRADFDYNEVKKQAECALVQVYLDQRAVMARIPFVIGPDDYTQRLFFYVEHIIRGKAMSVNNPDSQMAFILSSEAGRFLAHLGTSGFTGPINGCSLGPSLSGKFSPMWRRRQGEPLSWRRTAIPAPTTTPPITA